MQFSKSLFQSPNIHLYFVSFISVCHNRSPANVSYLTKSDRCLIRTFLTKSKSCSNSLTYCSCHRKTFLDPGFWFSSRYQPRRPRAMYERRVLPLVFGAFLVCLIMFSFIRILLLAFYNNAWIYEFRLLSCFQTKGCKSRITIRRAIRVCCSILPGLLLVIRSRQLSNLLIVSLLAALSAYTFWPASDSLSNSASDSSQTLQRSE